MNKIFVAYQYLFYKFYCFVYRLNNGSYFPDKAAIDLLGIMMAVNFASIAVMAIYITFGAKIGNNILLNTFGLTVFAVIFFKLHDYLFYKIVNVKNVIKKFENETKKEKILGNFFVVFYIIGSFFMLIGLALLSGVINGAGFSIIKYLEFIMH